MKSIQLETLSLVNGITSGVVVAVEVAAKSALMNNFQTKSVFWAFDPCGHGDIHDLGHGIQRAYSSADNNETDYDFQKQTLDSLTTSLVKLLISLKMMGLPSHFHG